MNKVAFTSESSIIAAIPIKQVINYQAYNNMAIFRSADSGTTWSQVMVVPSILKSALYTDQKTGRAIIVAKSFNSISHFTIALESLDHGLTWHPFIPFAGISAFTDVLIRFTPNGDLLVLGFRDTPDDFGAPRDSWILKRQSHVTKKWSTLKQFDSGGTLISVPTKLMALDSGAVAIVWYAGSDALPCELSPQCEQGVYYPDPTINLSYSVNGQQNWTDQQLYTTKRTGMNTVVPVQLSEVTSIGSEDHLPMHEFKSPMLADGKTLRLTSTGISIVDSPSLKLELNFSPDAFWYMNPGPLTPNGDLLLNIGIRETSNPDFFDQFMLYSQSEGVDVLSTLQRGIATTISKDGKIASLLQNGPNHYDGKIDDWQVAVMDCSEK